MTKNLIFAGILFFFPQKMDLKPYYKRVEQVLSELGLDPEDCRGETEGQWEISYGMATVMLDVYEVKGYAYFQCIAPILKLPENPDKNLFIELLEYNHTFVGVAFTKFKGWIFIKSAREFDDLSNNEMINIIKRVSLYADQMIKPLQEKYVYGKNAANKQSTPADVLEFLNNAVKNNNCEELEQLCDSDNEPDETIGKLCNCSELSDEERKEILQKFADMQTAENGSYFSHDGKEYAQITVIFDGKEKDLFFVKNGDKWFLYQITGK